MFSACSQSVLSIDSQRILLYRGCSHCSRCFCSIPPKPAFCPILCMYLYFLREHWERGNNSPKTKSGKGKSCSRCSKDRLEQQRRLRSGPRLALLLLCLVKTCPKEPSRHRWLRGVPSFMSACQTTGGNPGFPPDPHPGQVFPAIKAAGKRRGSEKSRNRLGTKPKACQQHLKNALP